MNPSIHDAYRKLLPLKLRSFVRGMLPGAGQYRRGAELRNDIARRYIAGEGIEIGALHLPLDVSDSARVKYVDRMTADELRHAYPDMKKAKLVPVDIVDNGESLTSIGDATQNFVIANHFLEHCQDPLRTLENMTRKLKKDGVLFIALPDKRFTFDIDRPITPLSHIIEDYEQGPAWSLREHYEEWVALVNKETEPVKAKSDVEHMLDITFNIHFHVWTMPEMLEMFLAVKRVTGANIEIELSCKNLGECLFVLRKMTA